MLPQKSSPSQARLILTIKKKQLYAKTGVDCISVFKFEHLIFFHLQHSIGEVITTPQPTPSNKNPFKHFSFSAGSQTAPATAPAKMTRHSEQLLLRNTKSAAEGLGGSEPTSRRLHRHTLFASSVAQPRASGAPFNSFLQRDKFLSSSIQLSFWKLVRQRRTDVKSFCIQLKKGRRGSLQEDFAREGVYFPLLFWPTKHSPSL